ncbi:MAG: winged helix-turn-helix domain-containing protein [Rhodothermales bacterium]
MPTVEDDLWIGPWLVHPALNRMTQGEAVVQLEPRIMAVLLCLASHAGEVVPRETLMDTVWPDVVVGEDPLNRAISTLRKVFGDDPRYPETIETIRKVGYRLIAPVIPVPLSQDSLTTVLPDVPPVPAVLPEVGAPPAVSARSMWLVGIGGAVVVGLFAFWWIIRDTPTEVWQARPFSTQPGLELTPAFSPDGSRLAYAYEREVFAPADLFVRLTDGSSTLRLTTTPADERAPAWSPDGQHLAFVHYADTVCTIMQLPSLGGTAQPIAPCTEAERVAWLPEGDAVLFDDQPMPAMPRRLYRADLASGAVTPFTDPPRPGLGDRSPAVQPTGEHVAFYRSSLRGLDQLLLKSLDTGEERSLERRNERIRGVAWHNAHTLVYASDWSGVFGIWTYDLRTDTRHWLLATDDGVDTPTAHPANGGLVYTSWRWDKNIWRADGDRRHRPDALASTRWDRAPVVSPDGEQVAFVSNRTGSYEVWLWHTATDAARQLTTFNGPNLGIPHWAPDGDALLIDVRAEGQADLVRIELTTGQITPVTQHPANDINAHVAPDGSGVYFASDRDGSWQIWFKASEGEAVPVTMEGGYHVQVQGEWLYLSKEAEDGLWRMRRSGGTAERLPIPLRARDGGTWLATPDGVAFVDRQAPLHTSLANTEANAVVRFWEAASGELRTLAEPQGPVATPGLALLPDGGVLYAQIDHTAADLMWATVMAQ